MGFLVACPLDQRPAGVSKSSLDKEGTATRWVLLFLLPAVPLPRASVKPWLTSSKTALTARFLVKLDLAGLQALPPRSLL